MYITKIEVEFHNSVMADIPIENVEDYEWTITFWYKRHFWKKLIIKDKLFGCAIAEYKQLILDSVKKSFRKVVNTHPDNKLTSLYAKVTFYKWKAHILSIMAQGDTDGMSKDEISKLHTTSAVSTKFYIGKDNLLRVVKKLLESKVRCLLRNTEIH